MNDVEQRKAAKEFTPFLFMKIRAINTTAAPASHGSARLSE